MFVEWFVYLKLVHLAATGACGNLPKAPAEACVEQFRECVLDGETPSWCAADVEDDFRRAP
jgi:hypothetical protein